MVKIANYAANQQLNRYLAQIQSRTFDLQVQISSGKRAQSYTKISIDSQFLVSMENSRDMLQKFGENNLTMDFRMQVTETTVSSIEKTIEEFLSTLRNRGLTSTPSESEVRDIQKWAFDSMVSIEGLLNSTSDGRYVFGGGRNLSQPVDLGLTTLDDFQAKYNGYNKTYPTTREAHILDFSQNKNSTTNWTNWLEFQSNSPANDRIIAPGNEFSNITAGSNITVANTSFNNGTFTVLAVDPAGGWVEVTPGFLTNEGGVATPHYPPAIIAGGTLTFTNNLAPALDTISGPALTFDTTKLDAGMSINISGTTGATNDGVYTVASVAADGSSITLVESLTAVTGVEGNPTTFQTQNAPGSISASSYYKGDKLSTEHRIDQDRSFSLDLNAINPAFEKAIRAMGIIAQGSFLSPGGLTSNRDRIEDAKFLLRDALIPDNAGVPPYGTEINGNTNSVITDLSLKRLRLSDAVAIHQQQALFYGDRIGAKENANTNDAITQLLNETNALEAAYQTIARVSRLSLVNYLS